LIEIKCKGSSTAKLGEIHIIQGNLKELTDTNYLKLKDQIIKNGFIAPFFVWSKQNGKEKQKDLLDGTQRKLTLLKMLEEKIPMPENFPIVDVDAPDEATAKKIILALSSQYGKMSEESLFEFAYDLISFEEMVGSFDFDAIDFNHFKENFFDPDPDAVEGEDDVPANAPAISQLGDVWYLGNHKIICGDSTNEKNLAMLLENKKPSRGYWRRSRL